MPYRDLEYQMFPADMPTLQQLSHPIAVPYVPIDISKLRDTVALWHSKPGFLTSTQHDWWLNLLDTFDTEDLAICATCKQLRKEMAENPKNLHHTKEEARAAGKIWSRAYKQMLTHLTEDNNEYHYTFVRPQSFPLGRYQWNYVDNRYRGSLDNEDLVLYTPQEQRLLGALQEQKREGVPCHAIGPGANNKAGSIRRKVDVAGNAVQPADEAVAKDITPGMFCIVRSDRHEVGLPYMPWYAAYIEEVELKEDKAWKVLIRAMGNVANDYKGTWKFRTTAMQDKMQIIEGINGKSKKIKLYEKNADGTFKKQLNAKTNKMVQVPVQELVNMYQTKPHMHANGFNSDLHNPCYKVLGHTLLKWDANPDKLFTEARYIREDVRKSIEAMMAKPRVVGASDEDDAEVDPRVQPMIRQRRAAAPTMEDLREDKNMSDSISDSKESSDYDDNVDSECQDSLGESASEPAKTKRRRVQS